MITPDDRLLAIQQAFQRGAYLSAHPETIDEVLAYLLALVGEQQQRIAELTAQLLALRATL